MPIIRSPFVGIGVASIERSASNNASGWTNAPFGPRGMSISPVCSRRASAIQVISIGCSP
jgi:hypothetical protein